MKYFALVLLLMLTGCFSSHRVADAPTQEVAQQSLGDFLQQWGIWLIPIGIIGLIAAAVAYRLAGKGTAQTVAIAAITAIGTGATLYYVGPWVGIIFAASAVVAALAVASLLIFNREKYINKLETMTDADLNRDGIVGGDK